MNWLKKKAQSYETSQHFQDPGNLPEFISGPSDADSIFNQDTNASEESEEKNTEDLTQGRIAQLILENEWQRTPSDDADVIEIENLCVDGINDNYVYDVVCYKYDEKRDLYETGRKSRSWDKPTIDEEVDY